MSNRASPSNDNALSTRRSLADIDRHVSTQIHNRCILLGLSVQEFAQRIGVTYQQAYKYESGVNKISAARLQRIAEALLIDVAFFFSGPAMPGKFMPSE